jgi:ribosomal protein S18
VVWYYYPWENKVNALLDRVRDNNKIIDESTQGEQKKHKEMMANAVRNSQAAEILLIFDATRVAAV